MMHEWVVQSDRGRSNKLN